MTTNYRVKCQCGFQGLYREKERADEIGKHHRHDQKPEEHKYVITEEHHG